MDKGLAYCRVRHCVQSFLRLTEEWRLVTDAGGGGVASRHLVCASCSSWIQFDSSGCDTAWAETREGSFTFTCKGCKRVEFLVRELAELREMLVGMKRRLWDTVWKRKMDKQGIER